MSTSRTLLLVILLAAGAGIAAWQSGFFDETKVDVPTDSDGGSSSSGQNPKGPSEEGDSGQNPEKIGATPFRPEDEAESALEENGNLSGSDGQKLTGRVVTPDGPGAGAQVTLFADNASLPQVHQLGNAIETVVADEQGAFSFAGLVRGDRVMLRVIKEGYTVGRAQGIDAGKRRTMHQIIRLRAGFGIKGRVTDTNGIALSGARVAAFDVQVQAFEPDDQLEQFALTKDDGTYELTGLAKGIKRIKVSKEQFASEVKNAVSVPEQKEGLDFQLAAGFAIAGRVVEQGTNRPVAGARIAARILSRSGGARNIQSAQQIESGFADDDGNFKLQGFREGNLEVWASQAIHLQSGRKTIPAGSSGLILEVPPAASVAGKVIDEITDKPVSHYDILVTANPDMPVSTRGMRDRVMDADGEFMINGLRGMKAYLVVRAKGYAEKAHGPLTLAEGQSIEDLVIKIGRGGSVRGQVVDQQGGAVAGARIKIKRAMGNSSDPASLFMAPLMDAYAQVIQSKTDASGEWSAAGLREGKWQITVYHKALATELRPEFTINGSEETTAPRIKMMPSGGIEGIVRTKKGEGDERATLTIISANDPSNKHTTSTDSNGRFQVLGLTPGDYKVNVTQREGVVNLGSFLQEAAGRSTTFHTVRPGQVLELTLDP